VAFTRSEKIEIAEALTTAGVDEIEAGTPAMGRAVVEDIAALTALRLPLKIVAWCRLVCDDVDAALAAGVKAVNLSAPMSEAQIAAKFGGSRAAMLVALRDVAGYARRRGLEVALGGEDSSRALPAELAPVLDLARDLGIVRFRFADTLGVLDPVSVSERIGAVRALTDIPIEFHGHDDLGLATANTLAALRAGASHASVTVLGLGERAGNAALEQVSVAVARLGVGRCGVDARRLRELAEVVARAARREIARDKPIIGDDIFTHESGIHVAGLLKNRAAYEALTPESLGRQHRIVLGRHSGARAIAHVLTRLGAECAPDIVQGMLPAIHARALTTKAPISDGDVLELVQDLVNQRGPAAHN
jgi:homocitrate synthase NifV